MKSTIEIYDSVLEALLNQDYFSNFKYRKKDKKFYERFSEPIDKTTKMGTSTTLNGIYDQSKKKDRKKVSNNEI